MIWAKIYEAKKKFNEVAIVTVRKYNYRIHLWGMNESEAMNRMKNVDLSKKANNYDYENK